MRINVYDFVKDDPSVQAVLGDDPMRFYPFGEADEEVQKPAVYATWQIVSGLPQNKLSGRVDLDWFRVQLDVWGKVTTEVEAAANALRAALEPRGYMVSINPEGRDPETRLYRMSFDFEFWQSR